MIPQRSISLISNKLLREGGKRVPESVIERDYVLAWLLTGLANNLYMRYWSLRVEQRCDVAGLTTTAFQKTWTSH